MNMPIKEKKVNFTTTLLALIRTSLCIKMQPRKGDKKGNDTDSKTYRYLSETNFQDFKVI